MGRAFLARIYAFKFLDGLVLIYPVYGVMFVDHGMTPLQVSIILMAWSITAFVLQIPSGLLADRWSRRWLLAMAQIMRGAGFLAWLLFPGFAGFLLGLALWGAKSAFTNGVFEALVYDELREAGRAEDYAQVIGRAQGFGFGAVLLASLGASVVVKSGYPGVLIASLGSAAAAAWMAVNLPPATKALVFGKRNYLLHLKQGFSYAASHAAIPGLIAVLALSNAFGGGLEGFWPIFGDQVGLPTSDIALMVAAISASQAAGAALAHRLRGTGETGFHGVFVLIGLLLAAAASIYQPWTVTLIVLLAGMFKVIDVNFDARLHHAIPTETRATLAAVKSFCGQVAMTLMFLGFGPLAATTSYRVALQACGAALIVIGLASLTVSMGRRRGFRKA